MSREVVDSGEGSLARAALEETGLVGFSLSIGWLVRWCLCWACLHHSSLLSGKFEGGQHRGWEVEGR